MMKTKWNDNILEDGQEMTQANKRNIYYSTLVKKIIDNNDATQIIKYIFFGIVCVVFIAVSLIGIIAILIIAKKPNITISDIGVAITSFGSVLSSIIALPKIIARHLFPENSEKVRFDFISQNQKLDLGEPEYIDDDEFDSYDDEEVDDDDHIEENDNN